MTPTRGHAQPCVATGTRQLARRWSCMPMGQKDPSLQRGPGWLMRVGPMALASVAKPVAYKQALLEGLTSQLGALQSICDNANHCTPANSN